MKDAFVTAAITTTHDVAEVAVAVAVAGQQEGSEMNQQPLPPVATTTVGGNVATTTIDYNHNTSVTTVDTTTGNVDPFTMDETIEM
mmetsp:Transcript_14428/g.16254  ORF Transcript_14428/g.16254 Transcript_14428/m.16254 type:complete len:86 (-) Transcript_14428:142-399(-)